jgi:hypothetical protein
VNVEFEAEDFRRGCSCINKLAEGKKKWALASGFYVSLLVALLVIQAREYLE